MDSIYDLITCDVQPGDEIVLSKAENVDVDGGMSALVEKLMGVGYKVVEEGHEVVLLRLAGEELKDEFDIAPRDNVRVDGEATPSTPEKEYKPSFKGPAPGPESSLPPAVANWIWAKYDVRVQNREDLKITLDNHDDQQAYAELFFKTAYSRGSHSDVFSPSKSKLRLVLDEVSFGVEESVLAKDELGAFIHEIDISVEPSPSWAQDCDRLRDVFPGPDPSVFQRQVGSSSFAQVNVGINPNGTTGHRVNNSTSKDCPAYTWLQAESSWRRKKVTWRWKMNSWNDSTNFQVNRSSSFASRFGTGDLRELPFPNPRNLNYNSNSFIAEATWEVPTNVITEAIEDGRSIQWIVKVKLQTAHVQRIIIARKLALKCRVTKGVFQFDSKVECTM